MNSTVPRIGRSPTYTVPSKSRTKQCVSDNLKRLNRLSASCTSSIERTGAQFMPAMSTSVTRTVLTRSLRTTAIDTSVSAACFATTRLRAETVRASVSYTHLRAHETVLDLVC